MSDVEIIEENGSGKGPRRRGFCFAVIILICIAVLEILSLRMGRDVKRLKLEVDRLTAFKAEVAKDALDIKPNVFAGVEADVSEVRSDLANLRDEFANIKCDIKPLALATRVDPLTGEARFGNVSSQTVLSESFAKALKFIKEGENDLALDEAEAMEQEMPSFVGAKYICFLVKKAENSGDEALTYGEAIVDSGISDNRLSNVYMYVISNYMENSKQEEAKALYLKLLDMWPDNIFLKGDFDRQFGEKIEEEEPVIEEEPVAEEEDVTVVIVRPEDAEEESPALEQAESEAQEDQVVEETDSIEQEDPSASENSVVDEPSSDDATQPEISDETQE